VLVRALRSRRRPKMPRRKTTVTTKTPPGPPPQPQWRPSRSPTTARVSKFETWLAKHGRLKLAPDKKRGRGKKRCYEQGIERRRFFLRVLREVKDQNARQHFIGTFFSGENEQGDDSEDQELHDAASDEYENEDEYEAMSVHELEKEYAALPPATKDAAEQADKDEEEEAAGGYSSSKKKAKKAPPPAKDLTEGIAPYEGDLTRFKTGNATGYMGVTGYKAGFRAMMGGKAQKPVVIGHFDTVDEAARAFATVYLSQTEGDLPPPSRKPRPPLPTADGCCPRCNRKLRTCKYGTKASCRTIYERRITAAKKVAAAGAGLDELIYD
jgi:hypothetical protein